MDCTIGQTIPDFVVSQDRNTHIAAKRKGLTVGTDGHVRAVNLAIARIEDVTTLVFQAVPFHSPDKGKAQERLMLAIIHAFRANCAGIIPRLEKSLCDGPFISAVALEDQYPHDRLRSFRFLPQATGRWFFCSRRMRQRGERREADNQ